MINKQISSSTSQTKNLDLISLVQELHSLTGPADLASLQTLFKNFSPEDNQLQEFQEFSTENYQRNLIAESTWFELLLLCFEPGQQTPIHDHAGSACGVRVIQGTATETVFASTPSGLEEAEVNQLDSGGVVGSVDMDIHQLSNSQAAPHRLVTLHVYSPPLAEVGNYSLVDNSCRSVRAKCNRKPK